MWREVVNSFPLSGVFIDPLMGSHVAHSVKMGSVFDGDGRRADVPNQHALFEDLDFFRCCDRAVDFSTSHECSSGNDPFDDRKFADYECAGRVNFPFEFAIDADCSVEIDDPFKLDPFAEEGKVVVICRTGRCFIAECPHDGVRVLIFSNRSSGQHGG